MARDDRDNRGEQHAERWIWLHGLGFAGHGADTWLDVAIGRVRLGPVTTPWVNGAPREKDATVTASVSAPAEAFAHWDYANPGGGTRDVGNCSVADLAIRVERPGHDVLELVAPGRAVYELGVPAHETG